MPRDGGVVADADEGDVGPDVLQGQLGLECGRGDASLLERPCRDRCRVRRRRCSRSSRTGRSSGNGDLRLDVLAREPRAVGTKPGVDGAGDVHDARHLVVACVGLRAAGRPASASRSSCQVSTAYTSAGSAAAPPVTGSARRSMRLGEGRARPRRPAVAGGDHLATEVDGGWGSGGGRRGRERDGEPGHQSRVTVAVRVAQGAVRRRGAASIVLMGLLRPSAER